MQDIEKFYELNQQLTMDDLARKKFTHTQAREKIKQFLANHPPDKKSREHSFSHVLYSWRISSWTKPQDLSGFKAQSQITKDTW
jgi:hypothetical protein